ncbi:MAG: metallophosphoesterase [Myxococcales bacterium]|nr:metallophosphoesterase [Myxococcales bacterium]
MSFTLGALLMAALMARETHARAQTQDPTFQTPPYLMDPQPTELTLLFELRRASAAEVTLTGPEGARTLPSPTTKHHMVRLRGLQPDASYTYQVRLAEGPTRNGHFRTPRDHERDDARLCLYGDSRSGEEEHQRVIAGLRRAHQAAPMEALVHLGDFAARGGELGEWVAPFASIGPLAQEVGLVPVLGNHELIPDGTGRPHYTRFLGRAMGSTAYYTRRFGPLHLVVLDTNTDWPEDAAQLEWAREQLRTLRAAHAEDFILVLAHHPMFSSSLHEDHQPLRDALEQSVREHADMVFGGHDHTYERGTVSGLHYVVSGGGGSPLYALNHRRDGQLAYAHEHHFVCVDVADGTLTLTAQRPDGTTLEACAVRRGEPFVCADGTPRGVVGGVPPWRFWITSALLWWRLGPALLLLAVAFGVVRRWLARRRARRAT